MNFRHSQVTVDDASLHVVEGGSSAKPAVLFLHGWPQSALAFEKVMQLAQEDAHTIAIDLPGIGASTGSSGGNKRVIARYVNGLIEKLELNNVTLVGHDVGGQIAFATITQYPDAVRGAILLNIVIPGIPPWETVRRNPNIWHFAFHNVPNLPELLVLGKQEAYFDWFFEAIAKRPEAISKDARAAYAEAYGSRSALSAGFDWYRAFQDDAAENAAFAQSAEQRSLPVLYVRGEAEGGEIDEYVGGLRDAGLVNCRGTGISDCGHFSPEEQPHALWESILPMLSRSTAT